MLVTVIWPPLGGHALLLCCVNGRLLWNIVLIFGKYLIFYARNYCIHVVGDVWCGSWNIWCLWRLLLSLKWSIWILWVNIVKWRIPFLSYLTDTDIIRILLILLHLTVILYLWCILLYLRLVLILSLSLLLCLAVWSMCVRLLYRLRLQHLINQSTLIISIIVKLWGYIGHIMWIIVLILLLLLRS